MVLEPSLYNNYHARPHSGRDLSLSLDNLKVLADSWLYDCQSRGYPPVTIKSYRQKIHTRVDFTRGCNNEISGQTLRLFIVSLQNKGLGKSTVHAYYRSVRTFLNRLIQEREIESDPAPIVHPPRIPKTKPRPFSNRDIEALLLITGGQRFIDYRNRAIVLVFLDTGLRLAEVSGLQLSDFNPDNGAIRVMGKGSKERLVRVGFIAGIMIVALVGYAGACVYGNWIAKPEGTVYKTKITLILSCPNRCSMDPSGP